MGSSPSAEPTFFLIEPADGGGNRLGMEIKEVLDRRNESQHTDGVSRPLSVALSLGGRGFGITVSALGSALGLLRLVAEEGADVLLDGWRWRGIV